MSTPTSTQHDLVVQNLVSAFRPWIRAAAGRGDVSTRQPVKIDDQHGYQPDLAWYPAERCSPPDEPASFSGLPELVVDVMSPSVRTLDLVRKYGEYGRIGIGEVWFVDPERQAVLVLQRPEPGALYTDKELRAGDVLTSPLLDDFELPVAKLFER